MYEFLLPSFILAGLLGLVTRRIVIAIALFFMNLTLFYLALPTVSFGFVGIAIILFLNGAVAFAITLMNDNDDNRVLQLIPISIDVWACI
jgi:hypothetical protein